MVWIDNERSWSYRKSHIINGSSGAGANYTVQLQIHYGSGSDSGSHVYLSGKCKSDFSDLRFTASDATTKLDYWIESKTDNDVATVWVKINGSLDSNQTIFLYYGNDNAVSESNQFTTGITLIRE
jgi:biopolymer transport protein ExbB